MHVRAKLMTSAATLLAATALTATAYAQDAKSLAEPGKDWETYHGSYKSWHYSPLNQINTENVSKLKVAFIEQVGRSTRGLETMPLGQGRHPLLLGLLQQGLRRQRRHRRNAVVVHSEARRRDRRAPDPLALQPRHGDGRRQALCRHRRRAVDRPRHEDRQAGLGYQAGQLAEAHRRLHRRAASGEGQGHHRLRRAASGRTAARSSASTPRPARRCGSSSPLAARPRR